MGRNSDQPPPPYEEAVGEHQPLLRSAERRPERRAERRYAEQRYEIDIRTARPTNIRISLRERAIRITLRERVFDVSSHSIAVALCIAAFFLLVIVTGIIAVRHVAGFHSGTPSPPYTVAVVGAGPAGVMLASVLNGAAVAAKTRVGVTVYDSNLVIGGRLAVAASRPGSGGRVFPYNDTSQDPISAEDIAGKALMWNNPELAQAAETRLGWQRDFVELPIETVGSFDGEKLVVVVKRPFSRTSWIEWIGLFFRYGTSLFSYKNYLDATRDQLGQLAGTKVNSDIQGFLSSAQLKALASIAGNLHLSDSGISDHFQKDIIEPQLRADMETPSQISSLQMAIALSKEDEGALHAGGDFLRTLHELLAASGAETCLGCKVTGIRKLEDTIGGRDRWMLNYSLPGLNTAAHFDHVVFTAPGLEGLTGDKSMVLDHPTEGNMSASHTVFYRPVFVTFFATREMLDPAVFGASDSLPPQILFVSSDNIKSGMFSGVGEISYVRQLGRSSEGVADGIGHLYRVISASHLPEDFISTVFVGAGVEWTHEGKIEHGSPVVYPSTDFPSFQMEAEGLWRTTSMESAGSKIDLSLAAAERVAELVIEEIKHSI